MWYLAGSRTIISLFLKWKNIYGGLLFQAELLALTEQCQGLNQSKYSTQNSFWNLLRYLKEF